MIDSFYGNNLWLSNFQVCKIEYDGYIYWSTQAAYQAQKFKGTKIQTDRIRKVFTKIEPNQAKMLGSIIPLREDWQEVRLGIMKDILQIKFNMQPYKTMLIKTGTQELVQGNYWHDTFFGKCNCEKHKGQGQNHLGNIIMQIRDELQNKLIFGDDEE